MMKHIAWLLIVGMIVLAGGVSAQESTPMQFFMTFVPNIQFAPVYVAIEKGYFADAGIDIAIEHSDEPVGVDLIAVGQRQFGLIGGDQVLTARGNDRPVVFVYNWFQQFPVGIVSPENAGIETVADLAGKRVGVPGRFGATYAGLLALLAANDMSEADINLVEIGFNAPEVMCVGAVDAAAVYINNEPLQIANRVAAGDCGEITGVNVIPVAEQANLVSNGIVTNEQTIAEQPELVRAVVGAFDRGLRDAIANPAEAYLLSAVHVEGLPLSDDLRAALERAAADQEAFLAEHPDADRETVAERRAEQFEALQAEFEADELLQYEVLLASIALWDAERPGASDPDAWERTQATLIDMGFLSEPIADLAAAYTNEFLPEE